MNQSKKTVLTLISFIIVACGYNPYGPGLLYVSTKKCEKLVESMARQNCHEKVNESYQSIREREDQNKRNNKPNLDFKKKKEPALTKDIGSSDKNSI